MGDSDAHLCFMLFLDNYVQKKKKRKEKEREEKTSGKKYCLRHMKRY